MVTTLEITIVGACVGIAAVYLIRRALLRKRSPGCGSNSACGDQCRVVPGKKD